MNIQPRETNNTSSFLKDASIFVLVLTGLTYFLAFNYKKGFLAYYEIDRLMLDNIGVYYINISFKNILLYVVFIAFFYLSDLPNILKGKEKYESAIVAVFGGTCFMILFSVVQANQNDNMAVLFSITLGIPLLCYVLFSILNRLFRNKFKVLFITLYRENINPIIIDIKKWVDIIKKSKHLIFLTSIVILVMLSALFWQMGYSDASSKTSYLVINDKSQPLVVIDQSGDKLLLAPLNIKKGLISPKYMVIESKSTVDKRLEFERYNFIGGLEVKKPKQLEPLNTNSFVYKFTKMYFQKLFQELTP
ncbi:hypothetical protein ABEY52_26865 [Priestia aryabhattai]|uniref:hypothetical protein n=1 Tax=Priestia aryabhattai TaxID=412384 RepID=UPI003D2AEF08